MAKIHFRTCYEMEVPKVGITFTEPSRTKQDYKDECDINLILERQQATGIISHVSSKQPFYGDVAAYQGDLGAAFEIVKKAEEAFDALPSALRQELGHDPRNLFGFITNPNNREKCIAYGIFNKPEAEVSVVRVEEG